MTTTHPFVAIIQHSLSLLMIQTSTQNGINPVVIQSVLSTQMALLRPSADILYVGTQKNKLGLKFSKALSMGMTWDAFCNVPNPLTGKEDATITKHTGK